MLPLSEIHRLVALVDGTGRCPVADAVAAAWDLPSRAARHWRSSASHVFHIPTAGYLRIVPAAHRSRDRVDAVAELMRRLHGSGLPVAELARSSTGNLVETVGTPLGAMHAMLVRPADGIQLDLDDLTPAHAREWGAALARLHHENAPQPRAVRLPAAFEQLDPSAFADDPPLAAAVRRLTDHLGRLPRDAARFGVVHGDFELDNLAWRNGTPTAYDFDEAAHSWFVADIAHAVRDLDPLPADPRFANFLAGYRQFGPLEDTDLALLPLFSALHAATALVRLRPVLDAGTAQSDPAWLARLRNRIDQHLQRQRATVLAAPISPITSIPPRHQ